MAAIAAAIGLCTAGAAQGVAGVAVYPDGRPAAGAQIAFFAAPVADLRWVDQAPLRAVRATADDDGRFRLRLEGGPGAGAVWATDGTASSAFVDGVAVGNPLRLTLERGASVELRCPQVASVFVQRLRADGAACLLCVGRDSVPPLPAGRYRALLTGAASATEFEFAVASASDPVTLTAQPRGPTLRVAADFRGTIGLHGWPLDLVALPVDAERRVAVPRGPGPRTLDVRETFDGSTLLRSVTVDAVSGERPLPAAKVTWRALQLSPDPDVRDSPVALVVEPTAQGLRLHARCTFTAIEAGGWLARVPDLPPPVAVLVRCPGFAPLWIPRERAGEIHRLVPGHALTVRLDRPGPHTDALPVTLLDREAPWLHQRGWTDARGTTTFVDLPATTVRVQLSTPRFEEQVRDVQLPRRDGAPVTLPVRTGLGLTGIAVLADGTPAPRAVVVLRDPTGTLRSRPEQTFADADGRFAFTGLGVDGPLTLSATIERAGQTWSAQMHGVNPGDDCRLELRLEDPPPPGTRRRK